MIECIKPLAPDTAENLRTTQPSFGYRFLVLLSLSITFLCLSSATLARTKDAASPLSSLEQIKQKPQQTVPALSRDEKDWLAKHPKIVLGASTDYPPMVIETIDETHVGVLVDVFEQISRYLNTRVRLHIEDSWVAIQGKAQSGEIDGLAFGARDPHRDAIYNATDVVMPTYFSVFGRSRHEYQIKSFSDLDSLRIGYKRGARPTRSLLEKLPSATLVPFDSHESMTNALLSREIDVIVAWISYDYWRKDRMQGTIDNILLIDEYPIEQVIHVRNDWSELIPILNKAIAALQKNELPRIINKWFGDWPQGPRANLLPLTPEELAWLTEKHTVRVRVADWPPYQIVKDNEPAQGIVIEYLKLIGDRTGITFEYEVADQPFAEFLASMKQHQGPDMTAVIASSPEREKYFSFSDPYLSSPYVIFIRKQDKPILDISDLTGKSLSIPRGSVLQERLASEYPDIRLALFDSDEGALQAVATGQADAYIGNLTVASHIIHKRGFSGLQVTAASPFGEQLLSMGNRKDWPELTSIINKALLSITEAEKTAIRNKYLAISYQQGITRAQVLRWILIIGVSTCGIFLVFVFWNRQMSREIKKRRQTEKDLKKAIDDAEAAKATAEAANQAKSNFLTHMSHELRTPLNAILGFSGMLSRGRNTTTDQLEKLAIINRSGQHLLSMINDVLDLSKIEAGRVELEPQTFNLPLFLKDIGSLFEGRTKQGAVRFVLDLDSELVEYVQTDAGKLRQILINLISNAVKFTDEGDICLRARSTPIPDNPAMCRLQLEVADSGRGIPTELLDSIFQPFVQDKRVEKSFKGTGLGLAICRSFVEMMDGELTVDSMPGKGSLFCIVLPVALSDTPEGVGVGSSKPTVLGLAPGQPAWRILVVEDNIENRLLLSSLLREAGFEVREAENGEEAMDLFQQWQPHLIWMDMQMPVMDGYEATRRIRNLDSGATVKIVAITASAFTEQRQNILAAGCDEVIHKPFLSEEIFESMARLLDITYVFEERGQGAIRKVENNLTAEMLADLPGELLQELLEKTLMLNQEAILEVIGRIEEHAPDAAAGLRELLYNYKMVELRELLGEVT